MCKVFCSALCMSTPLSPTDLCIPDVMCHHHILRPSNCNADSISTDIPAIKGIPLTSFSKDHVLCSRESAMKDQTHAGMYAPTQAHRHGPGDTTQKGQLSITF